MRLTHVTSGLLIAAVWLTSAMLISCNGAHHPEKSADTTAESNRVMPYETVVCSWSGEEIKTVRYGAKAVNGSEVFYFRSVEDLIRWKNDRKEERADVSLEVVDFIHGKAFIDVKDAVYLYSKLRPSPGGHHLSAVDKTDTRMQERIHDAYPGPYLSWDEVLALFEDA